MSKNYMFIVLTNKYLCGKILVNNYEEKYAMKKLISIILSVVMLFTMFAMPASAAEGEKREKCPIIMISGSSIDICDADGNVISTGFDVLSDDDEGDMSTEDIIEAAMNIIKPFILEGLPFDKWDNYGKALYEELSPIWDTTQLDYNGNAKYGTGVSKEEIAYWDNQAQTVDTGKDGKFNINDYKFRYDWRLSPYDHVDRLHQFIKDVIETTDCDQVALAGRCIGGGIITAYLEKYGKEGLVKKVFYDETMSNGSSVISDCFSGKIKLSDKHAQAYALESKYYGEEYGVGIDLAGIDELVVQLVEDTLEYLVQSGIATGVFGTVEALYERLYEVFMPAMLLSTGIGTWVNYWLSVYEDDMDRAIDLIFGKEGTETRAQYAGLIEKITYIREHITQKTPDLYKTFAEKYGVEVGILASYGLANAPITEHYDETGDVLVGVQDSSFGATASGLFAPLSDEYIKERIEAGYGEYISPDGRIDASTCLFPETTWFIKNKHHDLGGYEYLVEYFTQYSNVKVNDNNKNVARFLVYTGEKWPGFVNMTEENMADGPWITEIEQKPTVKTIFSSFVQFMKSLFAVLKQFFEGLFNNAE